VKIFCCICKRHIEVADLADQAETVKAFRALGHDDTKVPALRRGIVGVYKRDVIEPNVDDVPVETLECFENQERIAA
jgi:hypothetical protein